MKVIVVANQKGGIGKTTTACALASMLTQHGKKALLIDTDQQGNSTDTYGAEIDGQATLYDVLLDDDPVSLNEAVQHTEYGDIVAADPLLSRADTVLSGDVEGVYHLDDAIKGLKGYDYVIIDTAPALGELLKNSLVAADEVVIPLTADRYAIKGISQLVQTIAAVKRRQNPKLKVAGLLLIAFSDRTNLGKDTKAKLDDIAGQMDTKVFDTTIARTVKVSEAQTNRIPLMYYAPKSTAAQDYEKLYEELIGDEKNGKK